MTIKAQTESPPKPIHIICEFDQTRWKWHAEVFMADKDKVSEAWGSGPLIAVAIAITNSGAAL